MVQNQVMYKTCIYVVTVFSCHSFELTNQCARAILIVRNLVDYELFN